jgi:His-Xaa-Ser system radical SAM maturase HxsB
MPFRFLKVPGIDGETLVTSETGEYHFLRDDEFRQFIGRQLPRGSAAYTDLRSKKFLMDDVFPEKTAIRLAAARYRSKKAFLRGGPSLHIVVVTLRCDHSCAYCQVSRQSVDKARFDMPEGMLSAVVDRIFESRSPDLTVEVQGGEPLLAFDRIRSLVERVEQRNESEKRNLTFVVASTLHHATDEILRFFHEHNIKASTSLDGPEWLHNANRPTRDRDSYEKTVSAIQRTRAAIGDGNVSALLTLTRASLDHPREIIDTYVALGFRSIFLRPLSPFGFATRALSNIGYTTDRYLAFYEEALSYLIARNQSGYRIEEAYTTLLLTHILTPFATSYVDLRSPCGAALDTLVYNYDGFVFASDEGRMLAEMGNRSFALGTVDESYATLMSSSAMEQLLSGGVAESLPGCSDCAFLPYCGADPVYNVATQGDPIGHRPSSSFCKRQTGHFEILFRLLRHQDPAVMAVLMSWVSRKPLPAARATISLAQTLDHAAA